MMGTSAHHVLRVYSPAPAVRGARDSQHVGPEPIDG